MKKLLALAVVALVSVVYSYAQEWQPYYVIEEVGQEETAMYWFQIDWKNKLFFLDSDSEDETKVKVTIDTMVANEPNSVVLNLQTVGIFKIDKANTDETTYDHLIKANTVAIIFPFIRSQISLLTSQPGMMPIMLPPININALVENQ